jgi:hypothetical protein
MLLRGFARGLVGGLAPMLNKLQILGQTKRLVGGKMATCCKPVLSQM